MRDQSVSLGSVLAREYIGLEPTAEGIWQLWFGPIHRGRLTELGRKKFQLQKTLSP